SAEGVNSFRLRHALLYVGRGEGGVGADGALVHQRAPLDDHGTAVDRNFRVLKAAVAALVPDTQLQDLAAAASDRVLVALAAGLRIEERTEAIRDGLEFLELRLVCLVRRIVCDAVTLVVEAGWRRRSRRWSGGWRARRTRGGNQAEAESSNPNQSVHGSLRGFLRIRESMPVTPAPSNRGSGLAHRVGDDTACTSHGREVGAAFRSCGSGRLAIPRQHERTVMSARSVVILAVLGTALPGPTPIHAQQTPAASPLDVVPEKMPFDIPYGAPISLEHAEAAIAATVAEARKHDWKLNVAVVDSGGNLVAFQRMDGA